MAVSKVVIDGITKIDLTQDTVTAASMLSGVTAHKNDGTSVTGTISAQAAQTITPTTTDQTIASGKYLTGTQTIKGDANLVADNIKKDVTIFGVTGTHEGGGAVNRITLYASGTATSITTTAFIDQAQTESFLEYCNYDLNTAWSLLTNADKIRIIVNNGSSVTHYEADVVSFRVDFVEDDLTLFALAPNSNMYLYGISIY